MVLENVANKMLGYQCIVDIVRLEKLTRGKNV